MARWNVTLSSDFMSMLRIDISEVRNAQDSGEVPEYPQFVMDLLKDGDKPSEEFAHAAMGLVGEAAEVSELAKKVHFYDKPLNPEKLLEELGDMRFYYQAHLNMFSITDEMVKAQNVKKLRKRYATGKFSKEQANARADKPEEQRKFMRDDTFEVPVSPELGEKVSDAGFRALEGGPLDPEQLT